MKRHDLGDFMNIKLIIALTILGITNWACSTSITTDDQRKQSEIAFRERYKDLNIPQFTFDPKKSYYHDCGTREIFKDSFFHAGDQVVDWLDGEIRLKEVFKNIWRYKAFRYQPTINSEIDLDHFKLLHEKGHNDLAEKGATCFNMFKVNTAIIGATFALWGKYKKQPYKNIGTKLGSKAIVASIAGIFMNTAMRRFHEVYADNYACKHVKDKKSLEKVKNELINKIAQSKKEWTQLGVPVIFQKPIECLLDSYHSSAQTRLMKIQKTIDVRFS